MYSALLRIVVEIAKKKKTKSKISVKVLENEIQKSYHSHIDYMEAGGYDTFYQAMQRLTKEGVMTPIKASPLTDKALPLHEYYWIFGKRKTEKWDDAIIFMLSDEIDMHKYRSFPFLQTKKNSSRLLSLYRFLKSIDGHQWINREERSFMLFGDEKFLGSPQGKTFLNRINLTLDDLKIEPPEGELEFWQSPRFEDKPSVTILIVENHATYKTFKKCLKVGKWDFSHQPDMLVFGGGNGIASTLSHLHAYVKGKDVSIRYSGDIDPAGLNIFYTLVSRYPEYQITLAEDIYLFMLQRKDRACQQETLQKLSRDARDYIQENHAFLFKRAEDLFLQNKRIPQEIINSDTIYESG
ncbi:hypothetical protein HMPREF1013_03111 [Bacillus sp. 2_A_57_CT2]|nr:hypothetical protein HMPREF1013_03111 [Bacillus sp. 2_A_57_CT2]